MNNINRIQMAMKSLDVPTISDIYGGMGRKAKGLSGRNYKYPTSPEQGEKEKARRRRQVERGIIKWEAM